MSKIEKSLKSIYKKYLKGKPADILSLKQWVKQHDDKDAVKTWLKGKSEAYKNKKPHDPYVKKKKQTK